MMNRASFLVVASSLLAFATVPACGASVALEDRPCPCASGWTCCAERNVCVAPGTVCPARSPSDAGTDAPIADANPKLLAKTQSARCMTTDRDHLYWQNANGLLVRVAKTGGEVSTGSVMTPDANNARCGIAVDESRVYTTAYEYGAISTANLDSSGQWGGTDTFGGGLAGPSSIAIDSDWIYVTEYVGGTIKKLPKSGSTNAIVLASGLAHPDSIVIDDSNVYWVNRGSDGDASDGGTDASDAGAPAAPRAVMRVSKGGGDATQLALLSLTPEPVVISPSLAIIGRRLYWTEWDAGKISAIDVDGQNLTTLLSGEYFPGAIATDGVTLFWGASGIRKMPAAGGTPMMEYSGSPDTPLTVDDARVYWAAGDEIWTGSK